MKKKFNKFCILASSLMFLTSTISCNSEKFPKIDYSKAESWYQVDLSGVSPIDLFYIYPTVVMEPKDGDFATLEECRATKIDMFYTTQTNIFGEYCNRFTPMYRQVGFKKCCEINDYYKFLEFLKDNVTYSDICDSLDYFFEHYNNNRPFILSGHSQGSAIMVNVLTDYMQRHPEYLNRMICAYMIGFQPSKSMFSKYPNLKFATGSSDYGTIVSYNSFGPEHKGPSILHPDDPYVINPINWKTDDTKANKDDNLGSLVWTKIPGTEIQILDEVKPGIADAQIDTEKGILKISTITDKSMFVTEDIEKIFGTQSLHTYDYPLFYQNLKANGKERIISYFQDKYKTENVF